MSGGYGWFEADRRVDLNGGRVDLAQGWMFCPYVRGGVRVQYDGEFSSNGGSVRLSFRY